MKIETIAILFIVLSTFASAQWDDCPFEEINDTYPGNCERYIDTNQDDICDHSQEDPNLIDCAVLDETGTQENIEVVNYDLITGQEVKTKTVQEVADIYEIDANLFAEKISEYIGTKVIISDSFQLLHDNYGAEPSVVKDIAASLKSNIDTTKIIAEKTQTASSKNPYIVVPILAISIIVYIASYILAKKKVFKLIYHIRLWNYLLLASFLGVGLSGILLVLRINYGWFLRVPFNMLFWHVELGIAMTILAIFHIIWYMPIFRKFFRTLKKKN